MQYWEYSVYHIGVYLIIRVYLTVQFRCPRSKPSPTYSHLGTNFSAVPNQNAKRIHNWLDPKNHTPIKFYIEMPVSTIWNQLGVSTVPAVVPRTCVPEAGIAGMNRKLHSSDSVGCNYLPLPLLPASVIQVLISETARAKHTSYVYTNYCCECIADNITTDAFLHSISRSREKTTYHLIPRGWGKWHTRRQ